MHILIVEDEYNLADVIVSRLKKNISLILVKMVKMALTMP